MGYNDPRPLKEARPDIYPIAKMRVLSLGYQAAAGTFTIQANGRGLPIKENEESRMGDLILPSGQQVVSDFRRSSPKITGLWDKYDADLTRHKGSDWTLVIPDGYVRYFNVRETGRSHRGKPELCADILKHPSYPEHTKSLYGGKLTENAVQTISRYLLRHAILATADIATQVFHVHDEIVFDVPNDPDLHVEIVKRMETPPPWAIGIPLKVSSEISSHYTK